MSAPAPLAIAFWDIDGFYYFEVFGPDGERAAHEVAMARMIGWINDYLDRHDLRDEEHYQPLVKALAADDIDEAFFMFTEIQMEHERTGAYLHVWEPQQIVSAEISYKSEHFKNPLEL